MDRKKSSNLEGGALLTIFVKLMIAHDEEKWRIKRTESIYGKDSPKWQFLSLMTELNAYYAIDVI